MKFSIVTISFNQAQFLERTIVSVLEQGYKDLDYIIVDPGSTDGSREIIERYRSHFSHVLLEPDQGAADGLNKGFALATGEVMGFLNSDDTLLPGTLSEAAQFLREHPRVDVVSGDCDVTDERDHVLRESYSDRYSLRRYVYGVGILIQPSTFFRAAAYRAAGGFNVHNRVAWDGELFADMARTGARFARSGRRWSCYRLHGTSITGTGKLDALMKTYHARMFERVMGRPRKRADLLPALAYRVLKYLETPRALQQRVLRGPVYRRVLTPQVKGQ
ncbi:MAG: glycosyltransferase [Nevskiaceae bacterium]|jgi:glycosyltransferase involved in cell wall biosynthesis|nr:glycosyltransferase [Nevskiaceae bacterium]